MAMGHGTRPDGRYEEEAAAAEKEEEEEINPADDTVRYVFLKTEPCLAANQSISLSLSERWARRLLSFSCLFPSTAKPTNQPTATVLLSLSFPTTDLQGRAGASSSSSPLPRAEQSRAEQCTVQSAEQNLLALS